MNRQEKIDYFDKAISSSSDATSNVQIEALEDMIQAIIEVGHRSSEGQLQEQIDELCRNLLAPATTTFLLLGMMVTAKQRLEGEELEQQHKEPSHDR